MLERTLILVKPDGVQRGLVGEIIKRFEQKGLKIVAIKLVNPTEEQIGTHYAYDKEWLLSVGKKTKEVFAKKGITMDETELEIGERIRKWLIESLQDPIIAIVFEGYHSIEIGRKLAGSTQPREALPGTIRGDFSVDSYALGDLKKRTIKNIIHASDSKETAKREIAVWFSDNEIINYEKHDWKVIH